MATFNYEAINYRYYIFRLGLDMTTAIISPEVSSLEIDNPIIKRLIECYLHCANESFDTRDIDIYMDEALTEYRRVEKTAKRDFDDDIRDNYKKLKEFSKYMSTDLNEHYVLFIKNKEKFMQKVQERKERNLRKLSALYLCNEDFFTYGHNDMFFAMIKEIIV
jgi:hypothetical protein